MASAFLAVPVDGVLLLDCRGTFGAERNVRSTTHRQYLQTKKDDGSNHRPSLFTSSVVKKKSPCDLVERAAVFAVVVEFAR